MSKMVTITCIGPDCGKTQTLRESRLVKCDYYTCGRCGNTMAHPGVPRVFRVVHYGAAGGFTGHTLTPERDDPDARAAIEGARKLLAQAGFAAEPGAPPDPAQEPS
jgi:hypothetical protein